MTYQASPAPTDNEVSGQAGLRTCSDIAGHSIEMLAARAKGEAFYAYDVSKIQTRIRELREYLPNGVSLYFSPKVNPFEPLLHAISGLVDGFDMASGSELSAVLNTQISPENCLLTGPGKIFTEMRAAVAAGVIVNVESREQLLQTLTIARGLNIQPRLAFRINPRFLVSSMGLGRYAQSPFGIEPEELPSLLKTALKEGASIEGFHGFFGSQFHDVRELAQIQKQLFLYSQELANGVCLPRFFVNLGGGFPVGFFEGDPNFDLPEMGKEMQVWIDEHLPSDGRVSLIIELGRYLVAEAGYYVSQIIDVKTIGDEKFAILQGGLNHNMLATGVFGQGKSSNSRVFLSGQNLESRPICSTSIVGPLCTSVDRFATDVLLPDPQIGDHIVIEHCGAYGPSFSPTGFLGHSPAQEILVRPTENESDS